MDWLVHNWYMFPAFMLGRHLNAKLWGENYWVKRRRLRDEGSGDTIKKLHLPANYRSSRDCRFEPCRDDL